MPSLNFTVFVDKIRTGQKCITLRRPRKNSLKKGDKLHLFTGLRTAECAPLMLEKRGNSNQTTVQNEPFYLQLDILDAANSGFGYTYDADTDTVLDFKKFRVRSFEHIDYLERLAALDGFENLLFFRQFFAAHYSTTQCTAFTLQLIQFAPCPKVEALLSELKIFYG